MEKKFRYKKHDLIIIVTMNSKVEKHMGGKKWHKVDAICEELKYEFSREVEDSVLVKAIEITEQEFKTFVDNLDKPVIDPRLSLLGFK
jgi:hypothetical protein